MGDGEGFCEAGGEEDGEVVFVGEVGEFVEGGGGGGEGEEGSDGVDDDEGEIFGTDAGEGVAEEIGEGLIVGAAVGGAGGDGEDVDVGEVGVEFLEESGEEGVGGVVFGAE